MCPSMHTKSRRNALGAPQVGAAGGDCGGNHSLEPAPRGYRILRWMVKRKVRKTGENLVDLGDLERQIVQRRLVC
jgi:hypothetical protein